LLSSNCTVSCTGTPKMSLGRISYQISNYFTAGRVSALNNLFGYSTQVGNSTRSYVRNFWEKGTAMPVRGHLHKGKRLDGYNKNLYIKLWGGPRLWRPSEFHRKKKSWETKMTYKTGREQIMWNMIRGKSKYAEF